MFRFGFVSLSLLIGFVSYGSVLSPHVFSGKSRWTELNIGPFYVDTDGDTGAARDALTQLEQLRWVLGGLLESKDLPSTWPVRVMLTHSAQTHPLAANGQPIWQKEQYLLVSAPGAHLPLDAVAGILIDANTPRLPPEVETGLRQLLGTIQAHGSQVTWGGPPAHPDLSWARMQLFATKFEYSSSFHVFLTSLRGGSTLPAAEKNAFGKDPDALEHEAAGNLASHNWQPVSVSGRPLDPKRDLGEHSLDEAIAQIYLSNRAEPACKAAVAEGGPAAALGYECLGQFQQAIRAGSKNAPVYVAAAEGLPAAEALPLLKKAAQLNPLWAEPLFRQAQLASDATEKETLLKKATQLDPRATEYWIQLAQVETSDGHATAAQGSWLRAEDSAPTPEERERVHQLRLGSEQERLDAADAERRRERDATRLDDERAQQAEAERIRAAEAKANQAQDAAAGGAKPEIIVPYSQTIPQKKLEGALVRVDCLASQSRIWVKDKAGNSIPLLLKNPSTLAAACGPQQPARRVSLTYAADPDERFKTSGNVLSIKLQ
jgi:hypothetical protein